MSAEHRDERTVGPAGAATDRPRVALVYAFLAHYRAAIFQTLLDSERYEFFFVADHEDPQASGIGAWKDCPKDRFVHTWARYCPHPLLIQPGLLRLALRRDVDAIVFLGVVYWPFTWLAVILARLTGKRTLFWTHGWTRRDRGIVRFLRRNFYRLPHGIMTYGHFAKMIGIEEGLDPSRIQVIYNSLDDDAQRAAAASISAERLTSVREELFPGSSAPIAICTTRLIPVRRLDQLIDAVALLRDEDWPVNLLLVGDGPERGALEQHAKDRDVPVHFYGACYEEARLAELTMASSVTVAPGKVGLTAIQSLGFGTPVITHGNESKQMPEWEAVIPGKNGDVFRHGDVADLARAIRGWTQDATPSAEVRAACRSVIERFWNAGYQLRAIERMLDGKPADDLFWMKGC